MNTMSPVALRSAWKALPASCVAPAVVMALTMAVGAHGADDTVIAFAPANGATARLRVEAGRVVVSVMQAGRETSQVIEVDSEKALSIDVADYNFDGRKDFSISHIDDGMGTYMLYEIYVYSEAARTFTRLQPRCGGEFVDVVLDQNRRRLRNSYMTPNGWRTCSAKY